MAESQAERQARDVQVRATIHQKLLDSGEKDRLIELLREKLVECGWRDEMKAFCKGPLLAPSIALATRRRERTGLKTNPEVIKSKGLEKITVDELVDEITPRARAKVPDHVKAELLQRIRKFLQQAP